MTRRYSVAVIGGDGIGPEVVAAARQVIDSAGRRSDVRVDWTEFDWGSHHYRQHGRMMPADGLRQLADHEAIFFGAVGDPGIPDDVTLWGLLIPIRREFDQYINLRPARYLPGVRSPLVEPHGIDLVIVRENVEGEYSRVGGRFGFGTGEAVAQAAIFTRSGTARVARYAAGLARQRRGSLTSATKSNGIIHSMPFWDEVVAETVTTEFPEVKLSRMLVDALAAAVVTDPQRFDVIVASNLLGDILSDLTAACVGSIGLAPSANLNPERKHPSMFEPVHGSAPDITGRGIANPLAQVRTAAMMFDHLGEQELATTLDRATEAVLAGGPHTPDLGGTATTEDVTAALLRHIESPD